MDALIIKRPWIDLILSGKKIWEIRGNLTRKRGKIELIQSTSGLVIGCCELIDCIKLDISEYKKSIKKHCIDNVSKLPYKSIYAWVISNPIRYKSSIPYKHPKGAIIWVKL